MSDRKMVELVLDGCCFWGFFFVCLVLFVWLRFALSFSVFNLFILVASFSNLNPCTAAIQKTD